MKVLITGGRGQLGLELVRQIEEHHRGIKAFTTDIDSLDITDARQVRTLVGEIAPDVVINCAAHTDVDRCESDEAAAFRINALGAENLAVAAYEIDAKILQISTDYVFDGLGTTPLREMDPVGPINVYGKSKAYGEWLVRERNPRHFIVRTAWLYGEGKNFIRTMLRLAKEKDELNVVDDQIGNPTSAKDLARCILELIPTGCYGTYHGCCEGYCSWYELARRIFEYRGLPVRVNPIKTEALQRAAQRPRYTVLENFLLNLRGMNTFRPWEEALFDYLNQQP